MSDFKNKLKQSQGGGSQYPKLPVVHTVELKEAGSDVEFQIYDKDQKVNVKYAGEISGILIGTAMQVSSYSDNLGRNGGQYKSDFYVNNKNVVLFAPTANGYKVVSKGTMDEVEKYINENSTGTAKKRQVIFVLTPAGLLAVVTNLSIAIDQIDKHRESLTENQIVLTAKLFDEKDESISKKAKEFLVNSERRTRLNTPLFRLGNLSQKNFGMNLALITLSSSLHLGRNTANQAVKGSRKQKTP
ncbi:MAG: hypothetical protein IPP69_17575 [Flavobacteriales bacterium]|nr:hypothetical protein [Flavobacteriales bacterium]